MIRPLTSFHTGAITALSSGSVSATGAGPTIGQRLWESASDLAEQWQGLPIEWRLFTGAVTGAAVLGGSYWLLSSVGSIVKRYLGPVSITELEKLANVQEPVQQPVPQPVPKPVPRKQELVLETPLPLRLSKAQAEGYRVDLFLDPEDTESRADHYRGVIREILEGRVHLVAGGETGMVIPISEIVTVRPAEEDRTKKMVMHPRATSLRDKEFYDLPWSSQRILMDYADPRLLPFLQRNFAKLNVEIYRSKTKTERQATEEAFAIMLDHFWNAASESKDSDHQKSKRVRRIGDIIAAGTIQEAALFVQVIFQFMGINSRLERGSPFLSPTLWVRVLLEDGTEMIFDPGLGRMMVRGEDQLNDRFMELYLDDESDPPLHRQSTDGGMGFTDAAEYVLAMEQSGVRVDEVRAALIEASWVKPQDVVYRKDLMNWRRSQMERYISNYITYNDKLGEVRSAVTEDEIAEEARLAVIAYSVLSEADRNRLWGQWQQRPNGGLPYGFCEHWFELRVLGKLPFVSLKGWAVPPMVPSLRRLEPYIENPSIEWEELTGDEADVFRDYVKMLEAAEERTLTASLFGPDTELAPQTEVVPPEVQAMTQRAPETEVVPWLQESATQEDLPPQTSRIPATQFYPSPAAGPEPEPEPGVLPDPIPYDRPTLEVGVADLSGGMPTFRQGTPVKVQLGKTMVSGSPVSPQAPKRRRRRLRSFDESPAPAPEPATAAAPQRKRRLRSFD